MKPDHKVYNQKKGFVAAEQPRIEKLLQRARNAEGRGDATTAKRLKTDASNRASRAAEVEKNNPKPPDMD